MEVENKGKRISTEQREIMLDFMKKHPALATGRFTAPDGAKHKARLLQDLAAQLNSCSTGVTKSDDKWLKSWQDWRSDVKSKAALLKREINKTGGGSIKAKPLTPLEEQLLGFLGPNIVSGHDVLDALTPAPPATAAATVTATGEQGNSEEPLVFFVPTTDTVSLNLDGEPDIEASNVAREVSDSSSSETAKKQSRKRKKSSSVTSSLESECEDPLTAVARKQVELDEVKVQLLKEQIEISKKQLTAVEGACSAFSSAMIALQKYLERH